MIISPGRRFGDLVKDQRFLSQMNAVPDQPGISMTLVRKDGKLYAETLVGTVKVKAKGVRMIGMDLCGNELGEIPGVPMEDGTLFTLTGDLPALQYRIALNG